LTKVALAQIPEMTRAIITLGTGPEVIYFVDADDRIRWEEIDQYGERSLIVQMPKV
jgi:hypothetical protein